MKAGVDLATRKTEEMKPTVRIYCGMDGIEYACTACGAEFKENRDEPRTMKHTKTAGRMHGKPGVCPFVGKTFKVPVFELEEV